MDEPISATDANRYFSALIRGVREGQSYVVTSHGRPVARVVPAFDPDRVMAEQTRKQVFKQLRQLPAAFPGFWTCADGDAEHDSDHETN